MSVEVVMPQMGESITEGTISKWLKDVGETVERDEPLLEISTDKVDAEVPSPESGIVLERRYEEGDTVEVGTAVAVLGEEGETASPAPAEKEPVEAAAADDETEAEPIDESPTPAVASESVSPSENGGEATEVVMPQMGESITEGTISKWLKSVGDSIERDEPLLEISTDKVDAEVPSPVEGTILEIRHEEGETVEVDTVLALVGAEGSAVPTPSVKTKAETDVPSAPEKVESAAHEDIPTVPVSVPPTNGRDKPASEITVEELRRTRSSPLVRNIAKKHNIDISQIQGTGLSGRVTKNDILSFMQSGAALKPEELLRKPAVSPSAEPVVVPEGPSTKTELAVPAPSTVAKRSYVPVADRVEPMTVMRKKISEHMTFSKQTSAHVTSVYEIDMTRIAKFREANREAFRARYGTKLTFMPFIFQALTAALREFPVVNSQVAGDQIVYKGDINLGMAVALDRGLIVPVIRQADSLSLAGLARAANDLADRARAKKLSPDEVQGGTFTITNPGVFGGLFGTPIINQPQVAILCVGVIEKRPKVITTPEGDDYIGIRSMAYFALTYDHRIVDGADAEQFLSFLKDYLENTEFSI